MNAIFFSSCLKLSVFLRKLVEPRQPPSGATRLCSFRKLVEPQQAPSGATCTKQLLCAPPEVLRALGWCGTHRRTSPVLHAPPMHYGGATHTMVEESRDAAAATVVCVCLLFI